MGNRIPRHAFIDENSYFYHLYKPRRKDNPLYREMARVFHDALPDEVANCLTDELMNAEVRGELEQFRIEGQMSQVVDVISEALGKLAVVVEDADGGSHFVIPMESLPLLKNANAMSRLMR
jgi:hypothetical protein